MAKLANSLGGYVEPHEPERPAAAVKTKKIPPQQMDIEQITGKPRQPRAQGKSSQEGYERLTVYVRKETKDDLERSLIGTGKDMSDVVQGLLDRHLKA